MAECRSWAGRWLLIAAVALCTVCNAAAASPRLDAGQGRHSTYYVHRVYHTCANGGCGLHERTGPGYTKYRSVGLLHDGQKVQIVCQGPGQPVSGLDRTSSDVWDKLSNGHWVADYYINTPGMRGAFSPPIPRCGAAHNAYLTTPCSPTAYRPSEITLFCNPSVISVEYISGIHWSTYGGSNARGTGTLYIESCVGGCNPGHLDHYRAHVLLKHPRYCALWRLNEYTEGVVTSGSSARIHLHPYCGVEQLPAYTYTRHDGKTETLTPWQGGHVTVLTEAGARDPTVMTSLVGALDRAWAYYATVTGRSPAENQYALNGRDMIAEVLHTYCGPKVKNEQQANDVACTYIGATGTEILAPFFDYGYDEIAQHNLYDQVLFYELGRSFWFWGPQLSFHKPSGAPSTWEDPVTTGYAVLMRFESMAAAGVSGAPPVDTHTSFSTYYNEIAELASVYEANPSFTFNETLAQDKPPPGNYQCGSGACGGTDFWASLMLQLAARHGGSSFLSRFWRDASTYPPAGGTVGAVTHWQLLAGQAACTDLSSVFYTSWGFPDADGGVMVRPPASDIPDPKGRCGTG